MESIVCRNEVARPVARQRTATVLNTRMLGLIGLGTAMVVTAVAATTFSQAVDPRRSTPPMFDGYRAEGYPAISNPSKTIMLAFTQSGTVERVPVVESQSVAPGDVIAQLDDQVQRLTVEAQRLTAEDGSAVAAAERQADLARYDLENVKELTARDSAAPRELQRAEAEYALRQIDIQAARREHQQARLIYEREAASLNEMTLRSPINGIVARVSVEEGETLEGLEPVAHIVSIDPLWMDVAIPVRLGLLVEPGSIAIVRWRDVPGNVPSEGRVLWVSAVADAASSSIVARLEIDNPDRLPAGLHALVQFPEADDALRRSTP